MVPPSEVSMLFNSNLSRRPFLRQVVNLDLLLCTGFNYDVLFLCPITSYSETNEWSKDWIASWVLLWYVRFCQFHRNLINMISSVTCHCPKFTKDENLFDYCTRSVLQKCIAWFSNTTFHLWPIWPNFSLVSHFICGQFGQIAKLTTLAKLTTNTKMTQILQIKLQ